MPEKEAILVGISSCLLGEKVRYDGGHKLNNYLSDTLGKYFTFRPFCPEVDIGLGTPRETIKLVQVEDEVYCVGTETKSLDVTEALQNSAQNQIDWHQNICAYIFKKGSPSCGPSGVKLFGLDASKPEEYQLVGQGIYAKRLAENCPQLPIEDEERLGDPEIRDNFIKRVFIYRKWKALNTSSLDVDQLIDFHRQYEDILKSHDELRAANLETELKEREGQPIQQLAQWYFAEMMMILTLIATRESHVKVINSLLNYLSGSITEIEQEELNEMLSAYLEKQLPLLVPLTLLAHHFRNKLHTEMAPDLKSRIMKSKYIFPDMAEMMYQF